MITSNGRVHGTGFPPTYLEQTRISATFGVPVGAYGSAHTHPSGGRLGMEGDFNISLENPQEWINKIVVTRDSLFLMMRNPRIGSFPNAFLDEACARR